MEVILISRARYLATTTIASLFIILNLFAINEIAYAYLTDDATVAEKYINMEEAPSPEQFNVIAQVVDVQINDEQAIRVGLTEDYLNVNYTSLETDAEISVIETPDDDSIDIKSIVDNLDMAKEELRKEAELAEKTYSTTTKQGGLLDIANPDPDYTGKAIKITGTDRDILERLVMGEAGNQGFEGAALVAQCIRDMYILGNFSSVESVRTNCGYSGSLKTEPNLDVLDAVRYIFDQGNYAVKHRILYFYAPQYSNGTFHETQNFIIQYGGHKFFDRRY